MKTTFNKREGAVPADGNINLPSLSWIFGIRNVIIPCNLGPLSLQKLVDPLYLPFEFRVHGQFGQVTLASSAWLVNQ
jgi:hypothetical protein